MFKPSVFNISVGDNVIYNSYSGAILKLSQPIADCISSCDNIDLLLEQGFIVDEKVNELNKYLVERNTAIFSRRDRGLKYVIALTNDCQAHCSYCFERGIERSCYMSEDTVNRVLSFIKNQAKTYEATSIQITYFGGEPLLNLDALKQIGINLKQFCLDNQIKYASNIITNGIALTKSAAILLAEIGVNFAQITLDGTRNTYRIAKGVDAYNTVLNNIQSAVGILPIDIRLNITRDNMQDIVDLIDDLFTVHELAGQVQLTLAQVVDYVGCEFNSALCLDGTEYAKFVCGIFKDKEKAGKGSLKRMHLMPKVLRTFCGMENCMQYVIGADGELYKCEHSVGKQNEIVGDINVGSYYNDLEMLFYSSIPQKCIEEVCPFLPMCLGGCANERLHNKHIRDCNQIKEKHLLLLSTYLELLKN